MLKKLFLEIKAPAIQWLVDLTMVLEHSKYERFDDRLRDFKRYNTHCESEDILYENVRRLTKNETTRGYLILFGISLMVFILFITTKSIAVNILVALYTVILFKYLYSETYATIVKAFKNIIKLTYLIVLLYFINEQLFLKYYNLFIEVVNGLFQ